MMTDTIQGCITYARLAYTYDARARYLIGAARILANVAPMGWAPDSPPLTQRERTYLDAAFARDNAIRRARKGHAYRTI